MDLQSPQKGIYEKERFSALQAQRLAQEIAFGPVVFPYCLNFNLISLFEGRGDIFSTAIILSVAIYGSSFSVVKPNFELRIFATLGEIKAGNVGPI